MYPNFQRDIERFNQMYRLDPIPDDTYAALDSLSTFADILGEELEEHRDINAEFRFLLAGIEASDGVHQLDPDQQLDLRTQVADWLGDIVIYCCTYAARWGLPMRHILAAIMQSNFSKLGADGNPIYDERGKVMKGPGFQPPEPAIRRVLASTPPDVPERLNLTPTEGRLLLHFEANAGRPLTRDDLRIAISPGAVSTSNMVDVYVGYLRKKLPSDVGEVQTVRGVGYRYVPFVVAEATGGDIQHGN